jgi:hypothetical protein
MSPERLAEIREWLLDRSYRDRLQIAARSWTDVGLLVADRDRLEAENVALRNSGDALAEYAVEGTHFTLPDRGTPARHWWRCRGCEAPEVVGEPFDLKHESGCPVLAWRALVTPSRRREGEADV